MWQQVLDLKLSSTEYFNFVLTNLASEDTEDTVKHEIGQASSLISFFLPIDKQSKSREQFFETLLQIASKQTTSNNIKEKIIEQIDKFIDSENHNQLVVQWLERGQAFIQDGQQTVLMNLTLGQKRNLLKGICGQPSVQHTAKINLMTQILGDSLTDENVQARIFCLSAMPDAQSKQEAWNKIQNIGQTTKLSQKEMEQVIFGFS